MDTSAEVLAKAKRRIKRALATGDHQSRTYPVGDGRKFVYKAEHKGDWLYFRVDKLGRVYQTKNLIVM